MSTLSSRVDEMRETLQREGRVASSNLGVRGRFLYGDTAPSGAISCKRTSPLTASEIDQVVDIIAAGRLQRRAVDLPESLRTRDWSSVEKVILGLDERLGR